MGNEDHWRKKNSQFAKKKKKNLPSKEKKNYVQLSLFHTTTDDEFNW